MGTDLFLLLCYRICKKYKCLLTLKVSTNCFIFNSKQIGPKCSQFVYNIIIHTVVSLGPERMGGCRQL